MKIPFVLMFLAFGSVSSQGKCNKEIHIFRHWFCNLKQKKKKERNQQESQPNITWLFQTLSCWPPATQCPVKRIYMKISRTNWVRTPVGSVYFLLHHSASDCWATWWSCHRRRKMSQLTVNFLIMEPSSTSSIQRASGQRWSKWQPRSTSFHGGPQ